jgi:hypothetical protein
LGLDPATYETWTTVIRTTTRTSDWSNTNGCHFRIL